MRDIAILIPAAGASRRMRGQDKLLQDIGGTALLRRQVQRALGTGAHVAVTVPDYDHGRVGALQGLPVQIIAVPDADLGMSASLRRGVGMLPRNLRAVMVVPADMPDLTQADLEAVLNGFDSTPTAMLHQATAADGTPGHPVLFPADCFAALMSVTGDQGARRVLRDNQNRLRHVALPGDHALVDLDTPEAWAAWRKKTQEIA